MISLEMPLELIKALKTEAFKRELSVSKTIRELLCERLNLELTEESNKNQEQE